MAVTNEHVMNIEQCSSSYGPRIILIFVYGRWQRRSQEFDLGGYKLHDIEFVLGEGDKTTT